MDALAETRIATLARASVRCDVVTHAAPTSRRFPHTLAAALFILAWFVLNLAYIAFLCPHDLAPDEAHYWHWSRHLDWSYYSKGPLVAWLIRGSCELFGSMAFAVRLPAVASSAALLAGLYVLIADVLRDRRLALASIVCASTLPAISAGAVLMTIDPPFLACWCWALVCLNRASNRGSQTWWLLAGVCTALGVLAKYPMLLLPAAAIGHLLVYRRSELRRGGVWLFLGITTLGCVPILVWNANHDWVSFHHVLGQAGVNEESNAPWFTPLAYLGGQVGLLLGFWFAAFAAGAWRFHPLKPGFCFGNRVSRSLPRNPVSKAETGFRGCASGLSLVWWASVPVWGVFLVASIRTPGQLNWPAAAYVGGAVLAAAWIRERNSRTVRIALIAATILGFAYSVGLRFPQFARPALAVMLPSPSEQNPTPIRKIDPTCRLTGWSTLALEVDRLRDRVQRETGEDPVLAGMLWTLPGELSFYCREHPPAYSFGPALADRHSQYDLWRPNPVSDPEVFRGRSFIYVGERIPNFEGAFERVEVPIAVTNCVAGVPTATWTIWVCHGFRGFPERRTRTGY